MNALQAIEIGNRADVFATCRRSSSSATSMR